MRITKLKINKQLEIFFEFVELRTKIASLIPFLLGIFWSIYRYQSFSLSRSLVLFAAVLSFDMTTTSINNLLDYHKAINHQYKEEENVIGEYGLSYDKMRQVTLILLGTSLVLSLVLVFLTNISLLFMGGICFAIGILYTFGPTPISRTPYGELFSGLTMGFGITFIVVFVQNPSLMSIQYSVPSLSIMVNLPVVLEVFCVALPIICLISNIMLANNLCDLETDLTNERYTLVYYIGKQNGVYLYSILSLIPWLSWLLLVVFGFLPLVSILGFAVSYWHFQSVKIFLNRQVKRETFVEAIKSFKLFSFTYLAMMCLAIVLG